MLDLIKKDIQEKQLKRAKAKCSIRNLNKFRCIVPLEIDMGDGSARIDKPLESGEVFVFNTYADNINKYKKYSSLGYDFKVIQKHIKEKIIDTVTKPLIDLVKSNAPEASSEDIEVKYNNSLVEKSDETKSEVVNNDEILKDEKTVANDNTTNENAAVSDKKINKKNPRNKKISGKKTKKK